MLARLILFAQQYLAGGQPKVARNPLWRWVKRGLMLAIISAAVFYVGRRIATGIALADWNAFNPKPGAVGIALALTLFSVLCGGWVWQLVLGSLGYRLELIACIRLNSYSNLTKYVPGYAWQLMGKALLTRRLGVPAGVVGLGLVLELSSLIAVGVGVGLIAWPGTAPLPLIGAVPQIWRIAGAALLTLGLILAPRALPKLLQLTKPASEMPSPQPCPHKLLVAFVVLAAAWVALGGGLAGLIGSLTPLNSELIRLAIYASAFAFVVSLLVLFVPSGIGVREGLLIFLLSAGLPGGIAGMVAVASRLLLLLSELLAAGVALALSRWRP